MISKQISVRSAFTRNRRRGLSTSTQKLKHDEVMRIRKYLEYFASNKKPIRVQKDLLDSLKSMPKGRHLIEFLECEYPMLNWRSQSEIKDSYRASMDDVRKAVFREIVDSLAIKNKIRTRSEWNDMTTSVLRKYHYFTKFKRSTYNLLTYLYPSLPWKPDDMPKKSQGYWSQLDNRILFMDKVAFKRDIHRFNDWNKVVVNDLVQLGGNPLVQSFGGSVSSIINTIYPFIPSYISSSRPVTSHKPRTNSHNHEAYIDHLARELNIRTIHDWNEVKHVSLPNYRLISKHNSSIFGMISKLYPEFPWNQKKWRKVRDGYWESHEARIETIELLKSLYKLDNPEDWYRLSNNQISEALNKFVPRHVIFRMLLRTYPNFAWDVDRFSQTNKKSRQRWLMILLKEIYHNVDIHEDYKYKYPPDSDASSKGGSSIMELDIFIPEYSLAFEYHGEQHYHEGPFSEYSNLELQRMRDTQKLERCKKCEIVLVVIPYWWDKTIESLIATIRDESSGSLLPSDLDPTLLSGNPIPSSPM
eukprot:TRINITY_DN4071_c0_g1_i1.p1 TRINITY_DN4071_c0_g1~~TRINITY_DN4071_c0_g1_i1.p1  ORF type:complete len:529 (+),score=58.27 TRINITY_DN4071_c0_g1_i1:43-1629(+)